MIHLLSNSAYLSLTLKFADSQVRQKGSIWHFLDSFEREEAEEQENQKINA